MLKVPQVVIATAQMYFQRFFRHEANHSHHPNWIAITCIYLATKTEEEKRGYRDILTVFDDVIDGHENQPGSVPKLQFFKRLLKLFTEPKCILSKLLLKIDPEF